MIDPRSLTDASSGDPVAVLTWLADHPVPSGPSPEATSWRAAADALGPKAIPALIYALEFAPSDIRYTAQIALRQLGVEAWGHGYGANFSYAVAMPGEPERRIRPLMRDADGASVASESSVDYQRASDDPTTALLGQIAAAGDEIEVHRRAMKRLGEMRSLAVRQLVASGVSRAEVARRLGVHPNYVNQLAKGPTRPKG